MLTIRQRLEELHNDLWQAIMESNIDSKVSIGIVIKDIPLNEGNTPLDYRSIGLIENKWCKFKDGYRVIYRPFNFDYLDRNPDVINYESAIGIGCDLTHIRFDIEKTIKTMEGYNQVFRDFKDIVEAVRVYEQQLIEEAKNEKKRLELKAKIVQVKLRQQQLEWIAYSSNGKIVAERNPSNLINKLYFKDEDPEFIFQKIIQTK